MNLDARNQRRELWCADEAIARLERGRCHCDSRHAPAGGTCRTSGSASAGSIGQWLTLPNLLPTNLNPVHVTVMNNGKVLIIAGSGNDPTNSDYEAAVSDPQTNTPVLQPIAWDLFCNDMSVLPDGRVLINGGTLQVRPVLRRAAQRRVRPSDRCIWQCAQHGSWTMVSNADDPRRRAGHDVLRTQRHGRHQFHG